MTSNALLVFAALPVVFFFVIFISSLASSGGSVATSNALFSAPLFVVYGLGLFVLSLILRALSHVLAGVLDIASKS